ncbi:MAG TPA: hypothetical protein VHM70_28260 [Polyangiaceae bacterium]|jgi:hypothetical protein|nr:hypothetical protein [Polyangiaceae bacterium]
MKRLIDERPTAAARVLLEAGRDVEGSERGKARLLATLAAGTLVGASATQAVTAGKAWGAWLSSGATKVLLITAVAVGTSAGGWALRQRLAQLPSDSAQSVPQSALPVNIARSAPVQEALAPQEQVPQLPAQAATPALEPASEAAAVHVSRPRTATSKANEVESQRDLLEETQLLAQLRSRVEAGDRARAEAISKQYWKRFRHGQLTPEAQRLDERWKHLAVAGSP